MYICCSNRFWFKCCGKKKCLGSLNLVNAFGGVNSCHCHVVIYN